MKLKSLKTDFSIAKARIGAGFRRLRNKHFPSFPLLLANGEIREIRAAVDDNPALVHTFKHGDIVYSTLHYAASHGRADVLESLKHRGAEVFARADGTEIVTADSTAVARHRQITAREEAVNMLQIYSGARDASGNRDEIIKKFKACVDFLDGWEKEVKLARKQARISKHER